MSLSKPLLGSGELHYTTVHFTTEIKKLPSYDRVAAEHVIGEGILGTVSVHKTTGQTLWSETNPCFSMQHFYWGPRSIAHSSACWTVRLVWRWPCDRNKSKTKSASTHLTGLFHVRKGDRQRLCMGGVCVSDTSLGGKSRQLLDLARECSTCESTCWITAGLAVCLCVCMHG